MNKTAWYRRWVKKGTIYKRGDIFWYSHPTPSKRQQRISLHCGTKTEAGYRAQQILEAVYGNGSNEPIDRLLEQFGAHEKHRNQPNYLAFKLTTIRAFVKMHDIKTPDEITAAKIEVYLNHRLDSGLSPAAAVTEHAHLGRFFSWLVRSHQVSSNPILETERPKIEDKEIIHLTRKELEEVRNFARKGNLCPVLVLSYTGLRLGELERLRWSDLRFGNQPTIRVRATKVKGGYKSIPMHPELVGVLKGLPKEDDEFVFRPRARGNWNKYFRQLAPQFPKFARKGILTHIFRHTIASLILQEGGRIEDVSRILRHSSIQTTERFYAQFTVEHGGRQALATI
ncbi:hypothetical protein LCGC14_0297650 [marine sediment metagenome]|uniref:Tyr recombinase domain-containing protein n=1 Tax=marine sediment metagenome TaxID=412755 RepID=A0A0F9WCH4_9ZZZZ